MKKIYSGEGLNMLDCFANARNDVRKIYQYLPNKITCVAHDKYSLIHLFTSNKTHPNPPLKREGTGFTLAEVFSPCRKAKLNFGFTLAEVFSPCRKAKLNFGFTLAEVFSPCRKAKLNFGFTLAEVLITLGIIGVVAALTLPVITAKINDKVQETQNKKAQSIFSNGIKLLMAKEDVTDLQHLELYKCNLEKDCLASELKQVFQIISDNNKSLPTEYQFINGAYEIWTNTSKIPYSFLTKDGIIYGILKNEDNNDDSINVIVDINGTKRPNTGGKDLCKYTVLQGGILIEKCETMKEYNFVSCDLEHLDICNESECNSINVPCKEGEQCSFITGIWEDNTCIPQLIHSGGGSDN